MRIYFLLLFVFLFGCKKDVEEIPFQQLQVPSPTTYRDVHIFDEKEYIICGGDDEGGVIYKTVDGGNTWTPSQTTFANSVNCIYFLDNQIGFCADSDILIYKTSDGGITWNMFYATSWPLTVNRNLRDIYFSSDTSGFICGGKNYGNGVLYQTSNGGDYWSFSEFSHEYRGICFVNATHGVLCGYGSLLTTSDGGNTFNNIEIGKAFYTGITVDSNASFWMCDFNGSIYQSNDFGNSWNQKRKVGSWNMSESQLNCIAVSSSGRIACAGVNGFITWSDDSGNSWNDRESFGGNEILKINWIDNSTLLTTGKNGGVYKLKL